MLRKKFEIFSLFFISFLLGFNKNAQSFTTQISLGGTCPPGQSGIYTSLNCNGTIYTDTNYYYTCTYTSSSCSGSTLNIADCTGCTASPTNPPSTTCPTAATCTCTGYYANATTGSCIACPLGEYKSSTSIQYSCTKCPTASGISMGVTTSGVAATTIDSCMLNVGSGYTDSI